MDCGQFLPLEKSALTAYNEGNEDFLPRFSFKSEPARVIPKGFLNYARYLY